MKTSHIGLALIERFEGFAPTPYLCPAGYETIGYGHVLREGDPREVDEATAREILATDVRIAERVIAQFIRAPLTQNQCDALVSFTFNLGAATLQRSTLRCMINRGDYAAVPHQLMRFVWGGGRKLPGLARRRAAEAALWCS